MDEEEYFDYDDYYESFQEDDWDYQYWPSDSLDYQNV